MFPGEEPLVTVIMPVYNAGEYLRDAVLSIIDQTYRNLEILVIDDGSTDHCIDTISDIHDDRITIIRQENAGRAAALNRGLSKCKGTYYAIQDADDLSHPQRIAKLIDVLQKTEEIAAVFSGYDMILNGLQIAPIFNAKLMADCKRDIDDFRMPSHDPTGIYRVSLVAGMQYDTELRIGAGYDYILRVGEQYPILSFGECLYSYRINAKSTIRRSGSTRQDMIRKVWEKACRRRGVDFQGWLSNAQERDKKVAKSSVEYGVVAQCMESVFQAKVKGNNMCALKTSMCCLTYQPRDHASYKPLIYTLLPFFCVKFYRSIKSRVQRMSFFKK
ncbi:MAG: glycosyltransferase [Desulfobulbus sp.]|nr:glycosyltransferase [Desulfobulbus sp.]